MGRSQYVGSHIATWLQDKFSYICNDMNRGILRITLLLLATLAFVAHAVVAHHHHGGAVCFSLSAETCGDGCHGDGRDTCGDECSAKVLFTTPQQLSHDADGLCLATVDLPVWVAVVANDKYVPSDVVLRPESGHVPHSPLSDGYRSSASRRAPPGLS